ncbi:MAG TPA: hypothetical protein VJN62_16295, partial [Gemmatimonadales bacterium]|nr:hypothetical protein [Gemmatimonadales bacterium]
LAILYVHVSPEGQTIESRLFSPSNVDSITTKAMEMSKSIVWTPALKAGTPVDAWVQQPFVPRRQN